MSMSGASFALADVIVKQCLVRSSQLLVKSVYVHDRPHPAPTSTRALLHIHLPHSARVPHAERAMAQGCGRWT